MNYNRVNLDLGGGKLYQLANRSLTQMMSYAIETTEGKIIMIDGGFACREDADFLHDFLMKKGGRIDAWFITHAHDDHFGALSVMLNEDYFNLEIDCLYFDFPELEWLEWAEDNRSSEAVELFLQRISNHGLKIKNLSAGDIFDFGVKIEVMNSLGDYSSYLKINSTSILLKAYYPNKSVIFLADLADEAQDYVIQQAGDKLKCDIVQMAHHGQRGVNIEMYRFIMPKICLWTAPDWLWNNDNGGGKNSGPWLTLETREWMRKLDVQANFPTAYGDYEFD